MTTPLATYESRRAQFAALRDHYTHLSDRQGLINVAAFFAAVACFLTGLWRDIPPLMGLGVIFAGGFVVSFARHTTIDATRRRYATLTQINEDGPLRMRREWKSMPLQPSASVEPDHPFAADLDLFGHASLQHLLGGANTPVGVATLREWLITPATPEAIRERQAAVAELTPMHDLRDELATWARLMGKVQSDYEGFLRWAEGESFFATRPRLVVISRIVPTITLPLFLLWAIGVLPPFWIPGAAINLIIAWQLWRSVNHELEQVADRQNIFSTYYELFHEITPQEFTSPLLRQLQTELSAGGLHADEQMRQLSRLMPLIEFRRWLFFIVIEVLSLWSFHTLWFLERWRSVAGKQARQWLITLGKIEVLANLATLANDNPEWAFPEIEGTTDRLSAINLGHPLLAPDICVGNDVTLGPPGSFLLVTGSNMSGKSTLLRSIGVNVVLAQMGGPTCTAQLQLPPVQLATSIRVQDSLEQGVSYFMAELRRLKIVVDTTTDTIAAGMLHPLFLLDEILHGTNTTERQIAARQIILHLLDQKAFGAVSTHDLTLADTPDLTAHSVSVHFTEAFGHENGKPMMRFDYHLRPGIATSTNALKLMEIVGLPLPDPA